jgi:hypothetical protein
MPLWKATSPVSQGIRLGYRKAQTISPGAAPGHSGVIVTGRFGPMPCSRYDRTKHG